MFLPTARRRCLLHAAAAALFLCCFAYAASPAAAGSGDASGLSAWGGATSGTSLVDAGPSVPLALGAAGEETALSPRNAGEQSVPEQMLSGSYLGALFFGYPATGLGGADLVALAVLAYLVLRAVGGRKMNNGDRFTLHTRDDNAWPDDDKPSQKRPLPPRNGNAADPRDNAWSRRLKGEPDRGDEDGKKGRDRQHPFGDAPFGRQEPPRQQPAVTVKDRAGAMWAHLSSKQTGQTASEPAGTVAEGARVPAGFDVQDFLEGARALYVRLQKAWAARKLDDIAPFITEGMFSLLKQQAEAHPEPSSVDVVLVNVSLQNVGENVGDGEEQEQWADVRFNVLMRTGDKEHPDEINEQWRFVRGPGTGGMWRLSGIETAD